VLQSLARAAYQHSLIVNLERRYGISPNVHAPNRCRIGLFDIDPLTTLALEACDAVSQNVKYGALKHRHDG
jgi:hypothetical protein